MKELEPGTAQERFTDIVRENEPLASGEAGEKERVRSVLNYKKPAFWIIIVAVIVCIVSAVCLLTDPKEEPSKEDLTTSYELNALQEKYPEYFGLPTMKGLEVYVWQMAPDSFSCGVMPGTNINKSLEELLTLKGASIAEMRAILSSYDVDEDQISVIPWQNPLSSYIPEHLLVDKDKEPVRAEKLERAYVEMIRNMLFDPAQGGVRNLTSPVTDIKTSVAHTNWVEGGMMRDCLNSDKMIISSERHLPVHKLDTSADLDRFKETYKDILTFDQRYDEALSFNDVTASYDDSFFAGHTVILAYVEASSGSFRYAIRDVSFGGSSLCLNVVQTNHPEVYTADMAGWFVIAEVPDRDVSDITEFDAVLQR